MALLSDRLFIIYILEDSGISFDRRNKIEGIKIIKTANVLEDLIYRSSANYHDLYFVINKNGIFMKDKQMCFSSSSELKNVDEIVTQILDYCNEMDLNAFKSKIMGDNSYLLNTNNQINVYMLRNNSNHLEVYDEYKHFFNFHYVDDITNLYQQEYQYNHCDGFKIYVAIENNLLIVRSICGKYGSRRCFYNSKVTTRYLTLDDDLDPGMNSSEASPTSSTVSGSTNSSSTNDDYLYQPIDNKTCLQLNTDLEKQNIYKYVDFIFEDLKLNPDPDLFAGLIFKFGKLL